MERARAVGQGVDAGRGLGGRGRRGGAPQGGQGGQCGQAGGGEGPRRRAATQGHELPRGRVRGRSGPRWGIRGPRVRCGEGVRRMIRTPPRTVQPWAPHTPERAGDSRPVAPPPP
ncbi:hypothetical protein FJ250_06335 [bacterium]|nr:hypothetical protein [bacterium]